MLQNLIPSFPWIAPPRPPPWRNPRKERKGSNFAIWQPCLCEVLIRSECGQRRNGGKNTKKFQMSYMEASLEVGVSDGVEPDRACPLARVVARGDISFWSWCDCEALPCIPGVLVPVFPLVVCIGRALGPAVCVGIPKTLPPLHEIKIATLSNWLYKVTHQVVRQVLLAFLNKLLIQKHKLCFDVNNT